MSQDQLQHGDGKGIAGGQETRGSHFRAAAASADITPLQSVFLAGYLNRSASDGVHDALQANALLFEDVAAGRCAVLLTLDLLYPGADLVQCVERHLEEKFGIAADDVIIMASHSHFAPATDRSKAALGLVNEEYLAWCASRIIALLDRLFELPRVDIRMRSISFQWDGPVYRRRPWWLPYYYRRNIVFGQPVMAPNDKVEIDRTVRFWAFADAENVPVAVLWKAQCHPTGFPREKQISAEYIGAVRSALRREIDNDLPILFMQGFSGDIRPHVPDGRPIAKRLRDAILFGPGFGSFTIQSWSDWCERLAARCVLAFRNVEGGHAPIAGTLKSGSHTVAIREMLEAASPPDGVVTFRRLQIGDALDIFAVSAEPSNELSEQVPFRNAITVGYMGNCFGYWPSNRQIREGGYEARGFLRPFGLTGKLTKGLDDLFARAVAALSHPR